MRESAARAAETSSGGAGSRAVPEYGAGTTESQGTRESGETQVTPPSPQSETSEEGGRMKVRRRIVREEIVEEEPGDRS